jgi:hypothetical protein
VLVLLAVAAGWAYARGRARLALAAAALWALAAVGFWTLAMERPYGLLLDPAATAWAADVATSAAGGGGYLAGEAPSSPAWAQVARALGARRTLLLPTLVSALFVPAIGLAIALVWQRPHAALAAVLWMAASMVELDAGRGTALGLAALARPAVGVALVGGVAVALAVARGRTGMPAAAVAAFAGLAAAVMVRAAPLAVTDLPGVLVLDPIPWLVAAAAGTAVRRDPAACGLAVGGAVALVLAVAGLADPTAGAALLRVGLVLAAVPAIAGAAEALAGRTTIPLGRSRTWAPTAGALIGVAIAVSVAGSALTWWDPTRLDPIARDSEEPVRGRTAEAMEWIAAHTAPSDAFVAGEDLAPAVAALAGRPVLRAPTLRTAADDDRRLRVERAILSGRVNPVQARRYGLRYLLVAPRQFRHQGLAEPWAAEGTFPLRYERDGIRVYELPTTSRDGSVDVR